MVKAVVALMLSLFILQQVQSIAIDERFDIKTLTMNNTIYTTIIIGCILVYHKHTIIKMKNHHNSQGFYTLAYVTISATIHYGKGSNDCILITLKLIQAIAANSNNTDRVDSNIEYVNHNT